MKFKTLLLGFYFLASLIGLNKATIEHNDFFRGLCSLGIVACIFGGSYLYAKWATNKIEI
tara:strand:- start:3264 stop:3443 length:180 start_codon:yes stop_codon:yes gene_type:complete